MNLKFKIKFWGSFRSFKAHGTRSILLTIIVRPSQYIDLVDVDVR